MRTSNYRKNTMSLDRSAQNSRKMSMKLAKKMFRKPDKRCVAVIEMYQDVKIYVKEQIYIHTAKSCQRTSTRL